MSQTGLDTIKGLVSGGLASDALAGRSLTSSVVLGEVRSQKSLPRLLHINEHRRVHIYLRFITAPELPVVPLWRTVDELMQVCSLLWMLGKSRSHWVLVMVTIEGHYALCLPAVRGLLCILCFVPVQPRGAPSPHK